MHISMHNVVEAKISTRFYEDFCVQTLKLVSADGSEAEINIFNRGKEPVNVVRK